MLKITERDVMIRGIRLHVSEAGQGPLVLMLHGFPEFSYQWRRQIPALAAAGFHVVAPDQRGYALSEKPPRIRDYRVEEMTADATALIEAFGEKKATIVGHDWGGIVAYYAAMLYPQSVERLVILNAPHPAHLDRVLRRNLRQLGRSGYAFFFLLPRVPEAAMRAGGWAAFRRLFEHDANPGGFTPEDMERYVEAWSQPGSIRATINWYRAVGFRNPRSTRTLWRPIEAPTLILWGNRDRHLLPILAEPGPEWVVQSRTVRFPHASHWLHHEEADRVNEEIIRFITD